MTDNLDLIDNRLNFYSRSNPKFADKIFRRLLKLLHRECGIEMASIEEELSQKLNIHIDEVNIDPNRPMPKSDRKFVETLNEIILGLCKKQLTPKIIFDQINLMIKHESAKKIFEEAERPEVTFKELNREIQSFCNIMRGETLLSPEEAMGTRVALIRNLVSDQLPFIKIAKHALTIRDFGPMCRNMIGPEKGMGRIGGKAAGLIVAAAILENAREKYPEIGNFKVPQSFFIRSDVISEFIKMNNLDEFINIKYSDIDTIRSEYPIIRQVMKSSKFLPEVELKLRMMLQRLKNVPLVVRSSSLLEDSVGSAFSGKYISLFVGNQGDIETRLQELINAITQVYASTFAPDPMLYRKERDLLDYREQMAIIIQAVVGERHGDYFFPDFAGVGFSRNEYRWSPRIKREDGMLRLVAGLGTRAVDRIGEDFAKLVPLGIPTLNAAVRSDEILRYSQHYVDVINLKEDRFETISMTEMLKTVGRNIGNLDQYISIFEDRTLRQPASKFFKLDPENTVITFANLLQRGTFPKQMSAILKALEEAYGVPVDVEFAHNGKDLYLLQCRALSAAEETMEIEIPENVPLKRILFKSDRFIRPGLINDVDYAVYVNPTAYDAMENYDDLVGTGRAVGFLNRRLPRRRFILMGPGRWGSRGDIKLGVKISYADINNTRMLMEIARKKGNYVPDLSFGTHFFQDLVEAKITYLPLYPDEDTVILNEDLLLNSPNLLAELVPEYKHLANCIHVVDLRGKNGKGATIFMDGEADEALAVLEP